MCWKSDKKLYWSQINFDGIDKSITTLFLERLLYTLKYTDIFYTMAMQYLLMENVSSYNDPLILYSIFIYIHVENDNLAKLLDSPLSAWILLYTCHYFGNAKKKELHPLCTYAMLKNVNTLYIIRRNLSPFNVSWGSQLCMVREAHRVNSRDSWSSSYLPPHCL